MEKFIKELGVILMIYATYSPAYDTHRGGGFSLKHVKRINQQKRYRQPSRLLKN